MLPIQKLPLLCRLDFIASLKRMLTFNSRAKLQPSQFDEHAFLGHALRDRNDDGRRLSEPGMVFRDRTCFEITPAIAAWIKNLIRGAEHDVAVMVGDGSRFFPAVMATSWAAIAVVWMTASFWSRNPGSFHLCERERKIDVGVHRRDVVELRSNTILRASTRMAVDLI